MNDKTPAFSRSAVSCPWGKCDDAHIDIGLPQVIHDEVVTVAGIIGKSKTEWVRDLIIRELRGCVEVARMRYAGRDVNHEKAG